MDRGGALELLNQATSLVLQARTGLISAAANSGAREAWIHDLVTAKVQALLQLTVTDDLVLHQLAFI